MADPYLQSDGQTLRNKLGIEGDPDKLQQVEYELVQGRAFSFAANGAQIDGSLDREHLKSIHHHLFQDVYEWAGQTRGDRVVIEGQDIKQSELLMKGTTVFARASEVNGQLDRIADAIAKTPSFEAGSREQFSKDAGAVLGMINAVHPFREGNGRTQRIFMEQLAERAGHQLSFNAISQERMVQVSVQAHSGDFSGMDRMMREATDPDRTEALSKFIGFLQSNNYAWNDRYISTTEPGREYTGVFAGSDGKNFFMHNGSDIIVGDRRDLPADIKSGDQVKFVTSERAGARPELSQRLKELADRGRGDARGR